MSHCSDNSENIFYFLTSTGSSEEDTWENTPGPFIVEFRDMCRQCKVLTRQLDKKFKSLLQSGFDVNKFFKNKKNAKPYTTPLIRAIQYGNSAIIELLLDNGANVITNSWDNNTPLHFAVKYRDSQAIRLLLERGADMTLINKYKRTSFDMIFHPFFSDYQLIYDTRILDLLLNFGSNLEATSDRKLLYKQYFSLIKYTMDRNVTAVEKLLKEISDIDFSDIDKVFEPSAFAVHTNQKEILTLFMKKNANIEKIFFVSVTENNMEFLEMCLARNIDVNTRNENGQTALFYATDKTIIELLVKKYKCNPELQNNLGNTVAHVKSKCSLQIILKCKIFNLNILNHKNKTPLRKKQLDCDFSALLLSYGANPYLPGIQMQSLSHDCWSPKCEVKLYYKKLSLIDLDFVKFWVPRLVPEWDDWLEFIKEDISDYQNELEKLKKIIISRSTMSYSGINLYDLLFLKPDEVTRYAKNEILYQLFNENQGNFEKPYPFYGFALNYQYRRGLQRQSLMEGANDVLCFATGQEFPDEISHYIFQDLNDARLELLGEVVY